MSYLRMILNFFRKMFSRLFDVFFILFCVVLRIFSRAKAHNRPRLVWGADPIMNFSYWSKAMEKKGYQSQTIMSGFYSISKKSDFDLYFSDYRSSLFWKIIYFGFNVLGIRLKMYQIFIYAVRNFDIFHFPAHGFILRFTTLKFFEAQLLRFFGKKMIVLPYGSDFYRYSTIFDISLRHAILKSYPLAALNEDELTKTYNYWTKNATCFVPGFQVDASGRWDVMPFNAYIINEKNWIPKQEYHKNDGKNGFVNIVHTPNHRGFKGTEFIIEACEKLKAEGWLINLILIEKKTNDQVRATLQNEADILVEQIIASAYALSGIEGMASGIPVMGNLNAEYYLRAFRRYSFLNECPILATTPESIYTDLKLLVSNPNLRERLGKAGRLYVEKYHSEASAQYLFSSIYDKYYHQKDINLIDLYQPLNPNSYNNLTPLVEHGLFENKFIG